MYCYCLICNYLFMHIQIHSAKIFGRINGNAVNFLVFTICQKSSSAHHFACICIDSLITRSAVYKKRGFLIFFQNLRNQIQSFDRSHHQTRTDQFCTFKSGKRTFRQDFFRNWLEQNNSGIPFETKINQITREQRLGLVELIKAMPITPVAFRPIEEAIVTAGGVDVAQINPKTMESKLVSGLYFAGELLDVDGYTGGFNL